MTKAELIARCASLERTLREIRDRLPGPFEAHEDEKSRFVIRTIPGETTEDGGEICQFILNSSEAYKVRTLLRAYENDILPDTWTKPSELPTDNDD